MTRKDAKFQVSLTAPNCNATTLRKFHYQFWIFLEAITKDKKLKKMTITQFQAYIGEMDLKYFVYGIYEKG